MLFRSDVQADAADVSAPFLTFSGDPSYEPADGAGWLAPYVPGDLDGDGRDDLVFTSDLVDDVSVYLSGDLVSGGLRTYEDATAHIVGANVAVVSATGDVDGDDAPDLWIVDPDAGRLYLGSSSALAAGGTWTAGTWPPERRAWQVTVVEWSDARWTTDMYAGSDVTGDGVADLVIGNFELFDIFVPP